MEFNELKTYILSQVTKHNSSEDEYEYEKIESTVLHKILDFAYQEGFDSKVFSSKDDLELFEILDQLFDEKKLPKQTADLYETMKSNFWG